MECDISEFSFLRKPQHLTPLFNQQPINATNSSSSIHIGSTNAAFLSTDIVANTNQTATNNKAAALHDGDDTLVWKVTY